jgi:hypothetical protein
MCSGRVGSSCSTSGTRRVTLFPNPVISHELEKDQKVQSEWISIVYYLLKILVVIKIQQIVGIIYKNELQSIAFNNIK